MKRILIIGAGGHSKVVADVLQHAGHTVLGFLDEDDARWGSLHFGLPIFGHPQGFAQHAPDGLIIGVGANQARQKIAQSMPIAAHPLWISAVHPKAIFGGGVAVGKGTVIMANVVLNPDTVIGDHCIINTAASIDHDCHVQDFAHIAPGVRLAGHVHVGQGAFIGIGACAIPQRTIGAWAVVGAGAVIIKDIPDGVTAKGAPAR
jgi:sugar O-acyltransferase (sialic acid O-acetyltransferase NeuD family)